MMIFEKLIFLMILMGWGPRFFEFLGSADFGRIFLDSVILVTF